MCNVFTRSEWIDSAGGPLLLLSERLVDAWNGVHQSLSDLVDYKRACAVTEEIGTIHVASGMAVVLGDEPDRTCVLQGRESVILVRWRWAESEDSLLSAVNSSLCTLPFNGEEVFATVPGEHVLFDSACASSEIDFCIKFLLQSDSYLLQTALLQPDKNTCALLHKLSPFIAQT